MTYLGAFTPAEHSLRTFENVWKRFETIKNIRKHVWRVSVHTAWATSTSSCSQIFDNVPTMAPGLSKLSICAASIVILSEIEKRRHRKKRRMWESSFLKGRNYVQLLEKFKGGWNIHMLFTLDAQQTLNLFEHSQVYRQAAGHLRTFLNRVRKPYSARASVYTNWASIRERLQTVFTNNARLV